MPNWCYTSINIKGKDVEEEKTLYSNLEKWTNEEYLKSDFGTSWLGNVVERSGIAKWSEKEKDFVPSIRCRGYVCDLDYNSGITVTTETAWGPMMEMWNEICKKHLPSGYELYYSANEPGCEVYITNESEYIGKYYVNNWHFYEDHDFSDEEIKILESFESCDNYSEDDVVDILKRLLSSESTEVEDLLEEFNQSKFTDTMSINKWDFVEVEDIVE